MTLSRLYLLLCALAVLAAGCSGARVVERKEPQKRAPDRKEIKPVESKGVQSDALYFESPRQAVPIIKDLLLKKSWATLARYYDLSDSKTRRDELTSGAFFVRQKPPEVGHPAGFWRYKHPFSPSFEYEGHAPVDDGVVVVTMGVEIDQGGGMVQRGKSYFKMRKSDRGWSILPEPGAPPKPAAMPVQATP